MTREDFRNATNDQLVGLWEFNVYLYPDEQEFYFEEIRRRGINLHEEERR